MTERSLTEQIADANAEIRKLSDDLSDVLDALRMAAGVIVGEFGNNDSVKTYNALLVKHGRSTVKYRC